MARDLGATNACSRSHGMRQAAWVAFAVGGLLLVGCAAGRNAAQTVGGWFGGTRAAEERPRAYYAAAARVQLHRAPDASSPVVGELALHEGVLRSQVEGGFAYVKAEKSGRSGWVRQRDLIERLPGEKKSPVEATSSSPTAAPEPEATPDPVEEPAQSPEKSVFDPY